MRAKEIYGQHLLISAIKYLDGAPQGTDRSVSPADRRVAIRLMLAKLAKTARTQLERERADFWRTANPYSTPE
jgi:hypothetical protein